MPSLEFAPYDARGAHGVCTTCRLDRMEPLTDTDDTLTASDPRFWSVSVSGSENLLIASVPIPLCYRPRIPGMIEPHPAL